jgi:alpha-galactosidase
MVAFALLLSLLAFPGVLSLDNGLGMTPQMGWNSWNHFGCGVNQTVLQQTAEAFISLGLDKLGYKYVNVDDCWAKSRDKNGTIQPDTKAFPDFEGLIENIHSKGLLFGLYSDAGTNTCAGRPGSLGYEDNDAKVYAEWKVDYLKYDNCNSNHTSPEIRYPVMRDALNRTGRSIFYSMCEWGVDDPANWAPKVGNSWRTTGDIRDSWDSMIAKADLNNMWADKAGPGAWNDPDMLEIGNGHMSSIEYQTHMSLWCLMKAPLLIGCDLGSIGDEDLKILTNPEVIAINQDTMGVQGKKLKTVNNTEVWGGPLEGGSYVMLLLNKGLPDTANVTGMWTDFGLAAGSLAKVRDLWKRQDMGVMGNGVTAALPRHGSAMYKFTPVPPS